MGIFEDVVVNAKSAANAVGKKAGQIVDLSKLRFNAAEINKEIEYNFEALGRLVYDAEKNSEEASALVSECVAEIDALFEQLDAIHAQIAVLKKRVKCKSCGYENSQGAVFCNRCGKKLADDPAEEPAKEDAADSVSEEENSQNEN